MNPFLKTANEALAESPVKIDPISLALILYQLFVTCKKEFLRHSILVTERRPNSLTAKIVRSKIAEKLPDGLKTDIVIDPIIKAAIFAAKDEKLWNELYNLKDIHDES